MRSDTEVKRGLKLTITLFTYTFLWPLCQDSERCDCPCDGQFWRIKDLWSVIWESWKCWWKMTYMCDSDTVCVGQDW